MPARIADNAIEAAVDLWEAEYCILASLHAAREILTAPFLDEIMYYNHFSASEH